MTREESSQIENGIYNVTWRSGSHSVAAIGTLWDGTRWIAPINKDNVYYGGWDAVKSVELIPLLIAADGVCYGSLKSGIV